MAQGFPVDPSPHLLYQALLDLGGGAEPEALAQKVRQLSLGLPAEDEFSVLLSWLGRCSLVHKLDQLQAPSESRNRYRVPDLLTIVQCGKRELPALIEVKATRSPTLSWRPDYIAGLRRYGEQLGLPVLVAWKFKPVQIWTLFELRHFARAVKNYSIKLETAMRESLMGIVAGDFGVVLKSGVGLHFKMRKLCKLGEKGTRRGRQQQWRLRIHDVYFTNGEGDRMDRLGPGIWAYLLCGPLEERDRADETHFHKSFVVPDDEAIQWSHTVLPALVKFKAPNGTPVNWRQLLASQRFPIAATDLHAAANGGISDGVVRYLLDQQPHTRPCFLLS